MRGGWTWTVEFERGRNVRLLKIYVVRHHLGTRLGSVNTNAVSFVTASLHRSRPLAKPGRFENTAKGEAFWKRYGFIYRVNGETASIWVRLPFCREIDILQLTITWYKIRHAGGQAHYYSRTGTSKQRHVKLHWFRSLCFKVPMKRIFLLSYLTELSKWWRMAFILLW